MAKICVESTDVYTFILYAIFVTLLGPSVTSVVWYGKKGGSDARGVDEPGMTFQVDRVKARRPSYLACVTDNDCSCF